MLRRERPSAEGLVVCLMLGHAQGWPDSGWGGSAHQTSPSAHRKLVQGVGTWWGSHMNSLCAEGLVLMGRAAQSWALWAKGLT